MKYILRLLQWVRIIYKPTQFLYTNKIQDSIYGENHKVKSVGAGKVYVFCNKVSELQKLKNELQISDKHRIIVKGYPCLAVMGSKIGKVKSKADFTSLPIAEVIRILKSQRTDKVKI